MPGLNTEIMQQGIIYMVQTQNLGGQRRSIETTIYSQGLLLLRRSRSYTEILGAPDFEAALEQKMEEAHQEAIRDIRDGKISALA